jgi:homoserine dehydrogenase
MTERVHIGLLGFGCIGRATVRAAEAAAPWLEAAGLSLSFERGLVRCVDRKNASIPLVDDPQRFLERRYDVVIEVLGGIEPARTLVTTLLERGTPVVTANKSLLAAAGDELSASAARGRTSLRYEASALAGVPFLGTFGSRPLARAVDRVAAILNGTSNYILSTMEAERLSFDEALGRAQALGLAEPDPSADIEGRDAAEKLVLLLRHLGVASIDRDALETTGIVGIETRDLEVARQFGGRLKPVVHASIGTSAIEAFVGPAFVDGSNALSSVDGALNGIRLDGRFVRGLFFAGPGAGPEVTAATILDDVVETVQAARAASGSSGTNSIAVDPGFGSTRTQPIAPSARWFLRWSFPAAAPDWRALSDLLAGHGVWLGRTHTAPENGGETLWALTHHASRRSIDAALRSSDAAGAARTLAVRALES